jgi:hypothetical protein
LDFVCILFLLLKDGLTLSEICDNPMTVAERDEKRAPKATETAISVILLAARAGISCAAVLFLTSDFQ